jgi:DUF1680 family protein
MNIRISAFCILACAGSLHAAAQSKLYPQTFDLQEVTLSDSPYRTAMELNDKVLLQYDVDRLLTPFFRQAGMTDWATKHPNFNNWGSGSFRLDGHVGGHYLSALALAWAASHDAATKAKLLSRLNYMVQMMDSCQRKFDSNTEGLCGYIGGLPDNSVWTKLYTGDTSAFFSNYGNVPFYVLHKIYAGLRDAWVYGGNATAKKCFLKLCDWGINVTGKLSDATLQGMLGCEHGGMCEVYADAYQLTGETKYLTAAKRFTHNEMVSGMQTLNTTFLDSKHANTQVPKYIGFDRIAQQNGVDSVTAKRDRTAAMNFWADVTSNRTLALGGNSVDEHFLPAANCASYVNNPNGPESCNTNNMLKLSEDLFADTHDARYADFYEKAVTNHILSTQNPTTGGYVYFTALRPQHYRVYSQVNQGMWCCVGTGMENHSKYGEFIYSHKGTDVLFVNLFIASTLSNETFGLTQTTKFPYGQQSTLTIDKAGTFTLAVRHPAWTTGGYSVKVNGVAQQLNVTQGTASYVSIYRKWSVGDKVEISFPMKVTVSPCPNYTDYVALMYGPVLLAAKTCTTDLNDQFAGEGRMAHATDGPQYSLLKAPMLIGDRATVPDSVYLVDADKLYFKIKQGLYNDAKWADLILQPFFTVHEARYMMYWNQVTQAGWDKIKDDVYAEENAAQILEGRTVDQIATGEQQSDAGHARTGTFTTGVYNGEYYIDAASGKWFSYELDTKGLTDSVSLMCRYTSADNGRECTIYIDGKTLRSIKLHSSANGFYNVEYPIDRSYLVGADGTAKKMITVKFEASGTTPTPGVYYIRLLRGYKGLPHYSFRARWWKSADAGRVNGVTYNDVANTLTVNGKSGSNNIALQMDTQYNDSAYVNGDEKYLLVKGSTLSSTTGSSYLWWLNGTNKGSQVAATYSVVNADNDLLVLWDVTASGLDGNMQSDPVNLSSNGASMATVFGLTSTKSDHSSVISDIGFYTAQQAVDRYPSLAPTFGLTSRIATGTVPSSQPATGTYTLDGRQVSPSGLAPGVYISNGRKNVVR